LGTDDNTGERLENKEEQTKDDGRYVIFYWFREEGED